MLSIAQNISFTQSVSKRNSKYFIIFFLLIITLNAFLGILFVYFKLIRMFA